MEIFKMTTVADVSFKQGDLTITGKTDIGEAGSVALQKAMYIAAAKIDVKQDRMGAILGKENITAKDTKELNTLNNDISLLGSAQKALNQAAGQAQKMISA